MKYCYKQYLHCTQKRLEQGTELRSCNLSAIFTSSGSTGLVSHFDALQLGLTLPGFRYPYLSTAPKLLPYSGEKLAALGHGSPDPQPQKRTEVMPPQSLLLSAD